MKPFDALIFDVDGTLWYSCDKVARLWSVAATEYMGYPIHWTGDLIRPMFGQTMDVFLDTLLPGLTRRQKDELARRCWDSENAGLPDDPGVLYPGVAETMRALAKEYRLFIVSNCQKGYIEVLLDSYDLRDCVEGWLCWEDTYAEKDVTLRTLMDRYGLSRPVYVGDTQGDLDACRRAGIPMIYAAYGIGTADCPDWQVESFGDLPELLGMI